LCLPVIRSPVFLDGEEGHTFSSNLSSFTSSYAIPSQHSIF
jgi:hypothetical protein